MSFFSIKLKCIFSRLSLLFFISTLSFPVFSATPLINFGVYGVTSATYDPELPTNLTKENAIALLHWDINSSFSSDTSTNKSHGGSWIAFATATVGKSQYHPPETYDGSSISYYGRSYHVDAYGNYVGDLDFYYCNSCDAGNTFIATAKPGVDGGNSYTAKMYVR